MAVLPGRVNRGAHTDSKNGIVRRHWWTADGLFDRAAAGSILEINSQLLSRQKTEPVTLGYVKLNIPYHK